MRLPLFFAPQVAGRDSHQRQGLAADCVLCDSEFEVFSAVSSAERAPAPLAYNFKFPGLDQFPNIVFDDLNLQVGPDPNTPSGSIENLSTLQDNVTKTWGRHTFKAGYSATDVIMAGFFVQRARGDYNYPTLEQYVLDQMPTGGNLSGVSGERSTGSANVPFGFLSQAAYFNDDFRLRPNLTFNLGVRCSSPPSSRSELTTFQVGGAAPSGPPRCFWDSPTVAHPHQSQAPPWHLDGATTRRWWGPK